VYRHLQRLSLRFFTRTKTGEVLSRVVNDVGGVDNVLTNTATSAVQSATQAIAIAVALVIMDWQLALVGLIVISGIPAGHVPAGWAASTARSGPAAQPRGPYRRGRRVTVRARCAPG